MDKETLIETEFVSLWFYPNKKIIHHQIHQYVFGEPWRTMLETGAKALRETGSIKWLSDDRNASALPKEDEEWAKDIWTTLVLSAGFRHWALVTPEKMAGQMFHKRMLKAYEELGLNLKSFLHPNKAMRWLERQ